VKSKEWRVKSEESDNAAYVAPTKL